MSHWKDSNQQNNSVTLFCWIEPVYDWLVYDALNRPLGFSITGVYSGCFKSLYAYQPPLSFNKVYFHTSYKMLFCPQRHNITKHQNSLSLNSGGPTDAICLKISRFAVCFSGGGECRICFFFWRMFGICCYLHHVLRGGETEMFWQAGTQWHEVISCVTSACLAVRNPPLCFSGRGSCPKICFACRKRHVSQGHNFHWGHGGHDLCMNGSLHFHFSQRHHLDRSSQVLVFRLLTEICDFKSPVMSPSIRKYLQDRNHWCYLPKCTMHIYNFHQQVAGFTDINGLCAWVWLSLRLSLVQTETCL